MPPSRYHPAGCSPRAGIVIAAALLVCSARAGAWAQDPGAAGGQRTAAGQIAGTVRDSAGNPVTAARVSAGTLQAITDSSGRFTLRDLPRGPVTLNVRRLGFRPDSTRWNVGDQPLTLDLRLRHVAQTLDPVRVRARAEPYESRLAGFNARRAKKLGYYLTRDEIERGNSFRLVDALRRIPGVRPYTMPGALGRSVTLPGSRCPPLVLVDGFASSIGKVDLDMFDLESVEGVEVYPNGSSVPPELAGPYGMEGCGVIAIWSAPSRPRRSKDVAQAQQIDVNQLVKSGTVYLPDSVEEQARYVAGSARAAYPDSLYRAHVAGRVVARFVVDTAGDVEPGTITVLSSTHPALAAAVTAALPNAQFHPARLHGRPVRELVELPFDFDPSAPEIEGQPPE